MYSKSNSRDPQRVHVFPPSRETSTAPTRRAEVYRVPEIVTESPLPSSRRRRRNRRSRWGGIVEAVAWREAALQRRRLNSHVCKKIHGGLLRIGIGQAHQRTHHGRFSTAARPMYRPAAKQVHSEAR